MPSTNRLHLFSDDDEGAVTVEYAMLYLVVGAAATFLVMLITSDWFRALITDLIKGAIQVP
ncbi:DUF4244 domain-containing protein [Kibdelosporangium aridum]|uniref:DUF4244 domain-containing protein n=1 Tax=Kibdelosporangium aridum TaxID=2030 RepID=A0A1Y5XK07_KIBAR|nr:DUF4244 domain-containing protein [Kibdelosporangium aridum]SMC99633.1 Protein of unknown function [Kibdelosporangium aridum]